MTNALGTGNVNEAGDAGDLRVNSIAIYDRTFSSLSGDEIGDIVSKRCQLTGTSNLWGLWYGDSTVDRSGNGQLDATMSSAMVSVPYAGTPAGLLTTHYLLLTTYHLLLTTYYLLLTTYY